MKVRQQRVHSAKLKGWIDENIGAITAWLNFAMV
jgi:hypothetical protein